MKLLAGAMLAMGLCMSSALAADKVVDPKAETIKAEGKTACAHCEFDISENGCSLAIKDKAGKIFVLKGEGDAFKNFFKNRGDNKLVKIEGTKVEDKKAGETAYTVIKVTKIEEVK